VRVAREHDGNIELGRLGQSTRIVGEHDDRIARVAQYPGDLWRLARPEPDPGQLQARLADHDAGALISQHRESFSHQRRRHVAVVIVVAKNREHAVRCRQRREQIGDRLYVGSIAPGHVVAAENDQIRPLGEKSLHGMHDVFGGHRRAVMNVGQQADAKSVELGCEPGNRKVRARDLEVMPLVRSAVHAHACGRADRGRKGAFERRAAREPHISRLYSTPLMDVYGEFEWRGIVYDATEGLRETLARDTVTAYSGFDPTASSLHVGSLMQILALMRLQRAGHSPIALVGGGTGLIGDPSGKTAERTLQSPEQVEANVQGLRAQLARFLDFDAKGNAARLVNNGDWLTTMSAMEFLRDVGKYFSVNNMLAKESVKRRLESEEGISYTEFSYSLLQAYDFLVLHDRYTCTLQVGGSDQWGNIVAGTDLIRRLRSAKAHGLVSPLITTASGTKFGKTETGTIWLDAARTSPFRFYQFWLNTEDVDVAKYLKFFTFLDAAAIDGLSRVKETSPETREAQKALAREVTRLVHGQEHLDRAERASTVLFGEDIATLPADDVLAVFDDVPSSNVAPEQLTGDGVPVVALLASSGLIASKSEATRLIRSGGVYVNNRRVTDERARLTAEDAIEGRLFVLRKGAKQNHVVKIGAA
jgi:tyrosyl-tRNA synthetase